MKSNARRTHDKDIYLQEDRYDEPKEIFKNLLSLVQTAGALSKGSTVCDFGCATGEFLHYLIHKFPSANYYGFDVEPDLLNQARTRVPAAEFKTGSVLESGLLPNGSIDLAFMQGVHSIFEDFETCFSNVISWTKNGGRVYIVGMFNEHPVDVWVKYRRIDDPDLEHREPGWNIFSKASVARFLDAFVGKGRHTFTPFEMPFDLAPHPTDPIRTWTTLNGEGSRVLTNGISLICNLEILEIRP